LALPLFVFLLDCLLLRLYLASCALIAVLFLLTRVYFFFCRTYSLLIHTWKHTHAPTSIHIYQYVWKEMHAAYRTDYPLAPFLRDLTYPNSHCFREPPMGFGGHPCSCLSWNLCIDISTVE
jgi:hypothetical protein